MSLHRHLIALQTIWEDLPHEHINKAISNFIKPLTAALAVSANDSHFEHMQ